MSGGRRKDNPKEGSIVKDYIKAQGLRVEDVRTRKSWSERQYTEATPEGNQPKDEEEEAIR